MTKLHIKKGDTVYVNAGKAKGKTGKVVRVLVDKQRAIVEGLAGWHRCDGSPNSYFEPQCG